MELSILVRKLLPTLSIAPIIYVKLINDFLIDFSHKIWPFGGIYLAKANNKTNKSPWLKHMGNWFVN